MKLSEEESKKQSPWKFDDKGKRVNFPFGGGTNHTTDLGEGRYKVNSYVDAQNTFGANTRTYFEGVIKRKNGGWVLEYLTFKN